ncbi:MAG: hypothetical protein LBQ54_00360 [Planctomycetaceae bacterium]|jgi:hypothetical protein|nr:hypothetical protein [Planctomycetaceae bacterium]
MDAYHLPEHERVSLKRLHKTLKVKREADKVKAVYLLGSGWAVKWTAEALDLDAQTVRQYFLDYKNQDKRIRKTGEWVKLHDTGKESSLSQDQELSQHLDGNLYQRSKR